MVKLLLSLVCVLVLSACTSMTSVGAGLAREKLSTLGPSPTGIYGTGMNPLVHGPEAL